MRFTAMESVSSALQIIFGSFAEIRKFLIPKLEKSFFFIAEIEIMGIEKTTVIEFKKMDQIKFIELGSLITIP